MSQNQLQVKIINPNHTLYQGPALAVSSYNEAGIFDIMPNHAHYISLIKNKIIIHQEEEKNNQEIDIKSGILRCYNDQVQVYINL